ncbi:hypothetical protein Tco_1110934, partial [Tanacetum coccineum]
FAFSSINEIEALYDLFERLSYVVIEDGRINKLKEIGVALLSEMNVNVSDEDIEANLYKKILDAALNEDGKIASCYLAVPFPIEKDPTKKITDFNGFFNKKNGGQ